MILIAISVSEKERQQKHGYPLDTIQETSRAIWSGESGEGYFRSGVSGQDIQSGILTQDIQSGYPSMETSQSIQPKDSAKLFSQNLQPD